MVTLDTQPGGTAYLQGNSQTLTNTNNAIQGTGVIGDGTMLLTNGGVVDATPEGGTTNPDAGMGWDHQSPPQCFGGHRRRHPGRSTNVNNTGGTITASGSLSTVDIVGGYTITGGTLIATAFSGGIWRPRR